MSESFEDDEQEYEVTQQFVVTTVNIIQPIHASSMKSIIHNITANKETILQMGESRIDKLTEEQVTNLREEMEDIS